MATQGLILLKVGRGWGPFLGLGGKERGLGAHLGLGGGRRGPGVHRGSSHPPCWSSWSPPCPPPLEETGLGQGASLASLKSQVTSIP